MSVSTVSRSRQSETFAHFFPPQSRENDTVRLFAEALLPLLNQQWYLNTDRILHKIRSFKDQMKIETYEKCLKATQKYLNSRDFSVAGRYEVKKSWFFSGIQSYGETPRFQQLNSGLNALLKEVQPCRASWSESFRACWNGFIDCCSSAVSYTYNNPGKTACTFLALETAALAVRSYQQNSTFDASTSIVPWSNSPESHWSCGSNLVFGLSGTLLTQNPIFITAAGASCMPMAYSQIVNGRIPDQAVNVFGEPYSLTINMTELFGGPVSGVSIAQTNGDPLPDWLTTQLNPVSVGNLAIYANDIVIRNGLAYVAENNNMCETSSRLAIVNIEDKSAPYLIGEYSDPYSCFSPLRVAITENFAYLITDSLYFPRVKIIDISNSTKPIPIGYFPSTSYPKEIKEIDIHGNLAYLVSEDGLQIFNISDKALPVPIGPGSKIDRATGVKVSGNIAYVTNYGDNGQLTIVDVSNSLNPMQIGNVTIPYALGVTVKENFAYITSLLKGLVIVDVSNSAYPIVGRLDDFEAKEVIVDDNLAYVTNPSYQGDRVKIINVKDKTLPVEIGKVEFIADTRHLFFDSARIAVSDHFMYAATPGVEILDLSSWELAGTALIPGEKYHLLTTAKNDSSQSVSKSFFLSTDCFPTTFIPSIKTQSILPGNNLTLGLHANYLFKDEDDSDSLSLQMTQKAGSLPQFVSFNLNPYLRGSFSIINASGIAIQDDYAYVHTTEGLKIIDVSNSARPSLKGTFLTDSVPYDLVVKDDFAYLSESSPIKSVRIIDVQDKAHPVLISNFSISSYSKIAISENFAYIGAPNSLKIFDISDKTHPIRASIVQGFEVSGIMVRENIAYVASISEGLTIVDVHNKTDPLPRAHLEGIGTSIAVQDSMAYMGGNGLTIVDVSDSTDPILVDETELKDWPDRTYISGNLVYCVYKDSIEIIEVSNAHRVPRTTLTGLNQIKGAAFGNNLAYVVNDEGLKIFSLTAYQVVVSPGPQDIGNYKFDVIATDQQLGSATIPFELHVVGAPKFKKSLSPQNAIIGETFTSDVIPSDTFLDPNADELSYSAKQGSLPPGMAFDSISNSLKGTPIGPTRDYNVTILATKKDNSYNMASAEATWTISVHHAPTVYKSIKNQVVNIGSPWSLTLPQNAFTHPDNYPMTYRAMKGLDSLPSWMHFDNQNLTFDGVPKEEDEFNVQVEANDGKKGTAKSTFRLIAEHYPSLAKNFSTIYTAPGHPFTFEAFSYFANNKALQFNAKKLPSAHLYFDEDYCKLKGTFASNERGTQLVTLIATDKNEAPLQADFNIMVVDYAEVLSKNNSQEVTVENRAPTINDFLAQQSFKAGNKRSFSVANSFLDADGDQLTYRADVGDARWLTLNPFTGEFSGTPSDRDAAFYTDRRFTIGISATDPKGEKATGTFEILLEGPSLAEKLFSGFMSAGGVAVALFGYFQKRYLLWNWFRKSKYQKQPLEVGVGQREIYYQVSHPVGRISSIAVTTIKDSRCVKRESFWPNMFKDTETRTFLGGTKARVALLDWLDYDPADNQFHIAKDGPDDTYLVRDISVQIVDIDGRIMEEVPIVVRSNLDPSVAQEMRESQKATLSAASSAIHEEVQLSISNSSSSVSSSSHTSTGSISPA